MIAERFSEMFGTAPEEIIAEVINDRFPPYLLYQIIYTGITSTGIKGAQDQLRNALLTVHLHGANVPLSFNCRIPFSQGN